MTRRDIYLDAMLRHLGAAYYESLHGRATWADVARALDSVEDHTQEHTARSGAWGQPAATLPGGKPGGGGKVHVPPRGPGKQHHGRWHHRVRDVMTTDVVTVDRITPFKEIATLMLEHRVSAVPVLTMGRHVAGIVSEGDLLAIEDKREREAQRAPGRPAALP